MLNKITLERDKLPQMFSDLWCEEAFLKVKKIVSRLQLKYGLPTFLLDELLSCGLTALAECMHRFRPDFSIKAFWSFAFLKIRGAVIDFARQEKRLRAEHIDDLQIDRQGSKQARYLDAICDLKRIIKALNHLPIMEQRIIIEHYIKDRSFADIVRGGLGVKKSRLSKVHRTAIVNLRRLLE